MNGTWPTNGNPIGPINQTELFQEGSKYGLNVKYVPGGKFLGLMEALMTATKKIVAKAPAIIRNGDILATPRALMNCMYFCTQIWKSSF